MVIWPRMAVQRRIQNVVTIIENHYVTSTKSTIPRSDDSGIRYSGQSASPLPSSSGRSRQYVIFVRIECDSQN
jgi:hypothetical protein